MQQTTGTTWNDSNMNIIILLLPLEIIQAEILHFTFQLKAAELFTYSKQHTFLLITDHTLSIYNLLCYSLATFTAIYRWLVIYV